MKKISIILFLCVNFLFAFEELNSDNFHEKIKDKNVIVDFHAVWCPPCKVLNNKLEEFDIIKPENVTIYKVDIDKQRDLALTYGVNKLPSLVYFKNGKKLKTIVGIQSAKELYDSSKRIFDLKAGE